jgi:formylglycine-generating enzyme required for sulfatase activity
MLLVPGGTFTMGADVGGQDDEHPAHPVDVASYWLDRTEVTNAAYEACVAAGACTAAGANEGAEAEGEGGAGGVFVHATSTMAAHEIQAARWVTGSPITTRPLEHGNRTFRDLGLAPRQTLRVSARRR